MELTQNYREALLNELEKAQRDLELQQSCISKEKDTAMIEWFEISEFLAKQRIETIKKSISTNSIDY